MTSNAKENCAKVPTKRETLLSFPYVLACHAEQWRHSMHSEERCAGRISPGNKINTNMSGVEPVPGGSTCVLVCSKVRWRPIPFRRHGHLREYRACTYYREKWVHHSKNVLPLPKGTINGEYGRSATKYASGCRHKDVPRESERAVNFDENNIWNKSYLAVTCSYKLIALFASDERQRRNVQKECAFIRSNSDLCASNFRVLKTDCYQSANFRFHSKQINAIVPADEVIMWNDIIWTKLRKN